MHLVDKILITDDLVEINEILDMEIQRKRILTWAASRSLRNIFKSNISMTS